MHNMDQAWILVWDIFYIIMRHGAYVLVGTYDTLTWDMGISQDIFCIKLGHDDTYYLGHIIN